MVFNATFNNSPVVMWWSVLLAEETEVPGDNHRPAASYWQASSNNVVSSTSRLSGIRTHNVSNYHTITTTTAWEQNMLGVELFSLNILH